MQQTLVGNAVIGQSGGPTVVINQSLVGAIQEARRHGAIKAFYGARHGVQGILEQDFIDLYDETPDTLARVAGTPSAALGSVRKKPGEEDCRSILQVLEAHNVRYFFYIGGNDTAETASIIERLARERRYDLRLAHIPKTIDNDLLVTDHCPGYGSAARFVALALAGDNLDNRAIKGLKIDIIMGRHAGFLTAAAGLGRVHEDDGPHLIFVPEVPFDLDGFCGKVDACMKRLGRCVVAVSEGVERGDGQPLITSGERDSHGNIQLSGTGALGDFLAGTAKKNLGLKRVRSDTFGYLQRSFPTVVSEVDAREAREAAAFGVREMVAGRVASGSVALRRAEGPAYAAEYFLAPLESVARKTRSLDARFIAPGGTDITPAFRDYALPLIGPLPALGRLQGKRVEPKKL
jgi:6-phosphofructokinase 1